MSSKLLFYEIEDDGRMAQITHNYMEVGGTVEEWNAWRKMFRIGDIIGEFVFYPEEEGRGLTGKIARDTRGGIREVH